MAKNSGSRGSLQQLFGNLHRIQGRAFQELVSSHPEAKPVVQRAIQADRALGSNWVVTGGLAPGEKVITQGTANLKDGAQIKPVPASAPQRIKAPAPGAMKSPRQSG